MAGVHTAGAGPGIRAAQAPAVLDLAGGRRVLVWSFGVATSGIPPAWAATPDRAGVDLLDDLSEATSAAIIERVEHVKRPGDLVVASIHWGGNWGYDVPRTRTRREFGSRIERDAEGRLQLVPVAM